jgi:hypothetical protein
MQDDAGTVNSLPASRSALGLPSPVVSDLVDAHPRVTDNAPASFTTGTYSIVFTATDASGNTAKTPLTVNVRLRMTILNVTLVATQFRQANSDILAAELTVQVGPGNDGINPAADAFHILGAAGTVTLPVDIPLSQFSKKGNGI